MINRRRFLKHAALTLAGLPFAFPLGLSASDSRFTQARALPSGLDIQAIPASRIPQIISIFLYGGPSELAGNMSNAGDLFLRQPGAYGALFNPAAQGSEVTSRGFWRSAGGALMEELVANNTMSAYRTVYRALDDSKAHGRSVLQNLAGNVNPSGAGIATVIANILAQNNPFNVPLEELVLPFVSYEGDSPIFRPGDYATPVSLKPIALTATKEHPYSRVPLFNLSNNSSQQMSQLIASTRSGESVFPDLAHALDKRDALMDLFEQKLSDAVIKRNVIALNGSTTAKIEYPENNTGQQLRAAVNLCLSNPQTVFVALGGGLGHWDDHSDGLVSFPARMQNLMLAVRAATRHLDAAARAGSANANNIIINIYGDFGRNLVINKAAGWDHGNNQTFFTVGGKNIRPTGLGKIVGSTELVAEGNDRLFTRPTSSSYQCEPFAIASSLYKYFGVQNPQLLTQVDAINESL